MTVVRIGITTDWTCAILPWFNIRRLQMPIRAKVLVMTILSLGAIASSATIVRAPYLNITSPKPIFCTGTARSSFEVKSNVALASLPLLCRPSDFTSSIVSSPRLMVTLSCNSNRLGGARWEHIGDDGESTQGMVHTLEGQRRKK
ncbi:hypothetical protein CMQ_1491 [Grosmannia clavigera kw1407]|uniref:Rhodopsin domain-containing protein n=1 Tax=Grosmannia clavigera (strain kw1407 / UAMH 11150) TaxID=655863 RepID=F0XCV2_GROCL|nr:uncharacterized protein CMQ_1491 [Grosmannia clavigera kw1407]EFX04563.1 hypothetical protein CMQ_1491 [Grosmannia clavigera kw1407]